MPGIPVKAVSSAWPIWPSASAPGGEFPHEVGLFLSYPPQDVRGFIENHAVNYKCAGLWKVYGDEALARRLFDKFRKCTDIYCALWRAGSGIDQLAVAV